MYENEASTSSVNRNGGFGENVRNRRLKVPSKIKSMIKTVSSVGALELENKGAVARDHLANERTFLAWLRTSLSFASIGVAVTQLMYLHSSTDKDNTKVSSALLKYGGPLGASLIFIAVTVLILGTRRYFIAQNLLQTGIFPASRGSIIFLAFMTFGLILSAFAIVLKLQNIS